MNCSGISKNYDCDPIYLEKFYYTYWQLAKKKGLHGTATLMKKMYYDHVMNKLMTVKPYKLISYNVFHFF